MPFYNDTLWRPEEMNSRRPSLKAKQSLPTSGTPNGLGWEHADVRLPPSANLNPMHQVWRPNPHHTGPGQRFQFPASSHPPLICFLPQSSQQAFPRRAKWGAGGNWLKNSTLPWIKVFFENEYFFEVWIFQKKNNNKKNQNGLAVQIKLSLSHTRGGGGEQTLHAPGTVKRPKYYKINQ